MVSQLKDQISTWY